MTLRFAGRLASLRACATPLALTVLILAAASCARHLPTTPAADSQLKNPTMSPQSGTPTDPPGGVGNMAPGSGGANNPERQVMVTLAPGVDAEEFGQDYGATLDQNDSPGLTTYWPATGESPDDLANRMRLDSRVITSERNGYLETAESRQQSWAFDDGLGSMMTYTEQPAALAIGLDAAQLVSRGAGVLVAILDTGAELNHPALAGRVAGGWDFISGDADPTDQPDGIDNDGDGLIDEARGHGTHVAGIVARTAPDARLLIVRVLDADGRGDMLSVASGIRWAIDHGARVINLSLGMLRPSEAIENLLAQAEANGIVCVTSAGNWGADDPVEYPASSPHAVAVAAVDADRHAATFTSHGSFVSLSAPGVAIRSAYFGGRYVLWSGTSMAAPFVSGAAALLLSLHPLWNRQQVMDRLAATAVSLDELNPEMAGELGAGELDAAAALAADPLPTGTDSNEMRTPPAYRSPLRRGVVRRFLQSAAARGPSLRRPLRRF